MCRSSFRFRLYLRTGGWGRGTAEPPVLFLLGARSRSTPAIQQRYLAFFTVLLLTGCVQEMADQPRYDPLEANALYTDRLMSRSPMYGTIARGQLQLDAALSTGKTDGQFVDEIPESALRGRTMPELLARGQERYTIFCSHCHGQVGGGIGAGPEFETLAGMVVQRGFPAPPTYHQDRLRRAPIGHFFDVITNGIGRMPPHGYLIPPEDRWAIAAYVRALQLSQFAPRHVLAESDLKQLAPVPAP
jgi:mono/diheme cytochrome c family protein